MRALRWLEVSADYRCNNRCLGCFSARDDGPSLTTTQIAEQLAQARQRGARSLWLGGGEPTLRKDLLALVKHARKLGFDRVRLQTNGMLLSYAEFTAALVSAGVTEVSFSIKGSSAATHDRLTSTPGCYALMLAGMARVRRHGLHMSGDLLIYRSNLSELVAMVQSHFALGLSRFDVWMFSAADSNDPALEQEMPRYRDVAREVARALELGLSDAHDFITSLHTPPCTLPASLRGSAFLARELDLWVVDPGGHGFFLEESAIEGGVFLERCKGCELRGRCGGARGIYLRAFGDDEIVPVCAEP